MVELPTAFATKLAAGVELYIAGGDAALRKLSKATTVILTAGGAKKHSKKEKKAATDKVAYWHDLHQRLENFQQMAIACEYEDAVVAYHGIELSEPAVVILKLIHKSTRHWLIGAVTEQIINKIGNDRITNKDFAQLAVLAFENLINGGEGTEAGNNLMGSIQGTLTINTTAHNPESNATSKKGKDKEAAK